jgi:hypothetical protein
MIRPDGNGAGHRVTIVVVKLYGNVLSGVVHNPDSPRARRGSVRAGKTVPANSRDAMTAPILGGDHAQESSSITAQRTSHRAEAGTSAVAWRPGDPIPPGYALLNGKLVTRERALEMAGVK